MRVLVAGGTGVIGRTLVPRLIGAGHEVAALTRSRARAHRIYRQNAVPIVCSALSREELEEAVTRFAPEVVVNELTSIPRRLNPRRVRQQMMPTNRLRTEGTANLLHAARAAGARRFVSQSVAFAYVPGGEPAREGTPLYLSAPPSFVDLVRAAEASERAVLEATDLTGIVLRYGFLYGNGTVYAADGSFARDVARWRVPVVGDGEGVFSFVHVDDAADATLLAVEQARRGVYNIVDDEPAPVREWLPHYAELLDAPRPARVPRLIGRIGGGAYGMYLMTEQPGAANARARKELGWVPAHPTWRDGFRAVVAEAVA